MYTVTVKIRKLFDYLRPQPHWHSFSWMFMKPDTLCVSSLTLRKLPLFLGLEMITHLTHIPEKLCQWGCGLKQSNNSDGGVIRSFWFWVCVVVTVGRLQASWCRNGFRSIASMMGIHGMVKKSSGYSKDLSLVRWHWISVSRLRCSCKWLLVSHGMCQFILVLDTNIRLLITPWRTQLSKGT